MSNYRLIDTHCHLNFRAYADDLPAVMARCEEVGVQHVIVPAIDLDGCQEALALAREFPAVNCALGIHPNSLARDMSWGIDCIRDWAGEKVVAAIGEIGLDYHWRKNPKRNQIAAFERQLELAAELGLPVIVHNREASDDVLAVLETWAGNLPPSMRGSPGVLHAFSGSATHAERALELGFALGFAGPVTFKKADALRAIARIVPLDRILIETDGPFLTPHPHRGRRNEPAYVRFINDRLAELHGISAGEMASQTTANAENLFALRQSLEKA